MRAFRKPVALNFLFCAVMAAQAATEADRACQSEDNRKQLAAGLVHYRQPGAMRGAAPEFPGSGK